MCVYIVYENVSFSSSVVQGVFKSWESACMFRNKLIILRRQLDKRFRDDDVWIDDVKVED